MTPSCGAGSAPSEAALAFAKANPEHMTYHFAHAKASRPGRTPAPRRIDSPNLLNRPQQSGNVVDIDRRHWRQRRRRHPSVLVREPRTGDPIVNVHMRLARARRPVAATLAAASAPAAAR
jgi:hypothetical protein